MVHGPGRHLALAVRGILKKFALPIPRKRPVLARSRARLRARPKIDLKFYWSFLSEALFTPRVLRFQVKVSKLQCPFIASEAKPPHWSTKYIDYGSFWTIDYGSFFSSSLASECTLELACRARPNPHKEKSKRAPASQDGCTLELTRERDLVVCCKLLDLIFKSLNAESWIFWTAQHSLCLTRVVHKKWHAHTRFC